MYQIRKVLSVYANNKVSEEAKIRNLYNQVPQLPQDTTWDSDKHTINITYNSQIAFLYSCAKEIFMNFITLSSIS